MAELFYLKGLKMIPTISLHVIVVVVWMLSSMLCRAIFFCREWPFIPYLVPISGDPQNYFVKDQEATGRLS